MKSSRKGLRRRGQREYVVGFGSKVWIIERDCPWRWIVRPDGWPRDPKGVFFSMKFDRLYKARAHAEEQAGL